MPYYCDRCDRQFNTLHALDQHETDSLHHNQCDECYLDFVTWNELKQHFIASTDHAYCRFCDKHFYDEEDLQQHGEAKHFACEPCNRLYETQSNLNVHYIISKHHHYCAPCFRHFQNASNLCSHLKSAIHHPKDVHCPFGCDQAFVSHSALVLHLEGGRCSSGVDSKAINKYIRQYDTQNIITDPSLLLTGSDGHNVITYIATDLSWNGQGYECYLCNKEFASLRSLNQHLASPRHQDKIYICRGPGCRIHFSALSALVQHIESEKCGFLKLKSVKMGFDRLLGQMGRLNL